MSLMKTLARVAAGVMVAKGVGAMMRRGQQSNRTTGGGILGDLFGPQGQQAGSTRSGGGGLGDILGQVLGGGTQTRAGQGAGSGSSYGGTYSPNGGASGGLGGALDQLSGSQSARNRSAQAQSQGSGNILDAILGGTGGAAATGAAAGGLGGLLGGLLGNNLAAKDSQPENNRSFGEVFNDSLQKQDEPSVAPTPEQNAVAGLMLKAMIQAAKSDGKIDEGEKQRLMGEVGDLDDKERAFIREQMQAPVDVQALAREVPPGLEQQVYMMSLMAIDFDSKAEAQYLNDLAQAMGLNQQEVNAIHTQVGVQNLYA
ncbi:tellurite resistance TerB family protein [Paracoccus pacificus]|uniref:Tellurite resistance TerB family protein n=1 Tax=Paracoccus pacificus TaxID=1463598 RepID=A0ABW4RB74_9RHOB